MNETISPENANPETSGSELKGTGIPEGRVSEADVVQFLQNSRAGDTAEAQPSEDGVTEEPEGEADQPDLLEDEAETETSEETDDAEQDDPEYIDLTDDYTLDVKVSGEMQKVSLADLKENYSGRSELSRQYQKMRDEQNQIAETQKKVSEDRNEYEGLLTHAKSMLESMKGKPPDRTLLDDDPTEYQRRKLVYDDRVSAIEQMDQEIKKTQEEKTEENQKLLNDYAQREYQKIVQILPDWEKKDKDGKFFVREAILNYAKDAGASEDQIRGVHPAWLYKALYDASQYRNIENKKPAIRKRSKALPKVRVPGTQARDSAKTQEVKATKNFLMKGNKGSSRQREAAAIRLIRETRNR